MSEGAGLARRILFALAAIGAACVMIGLFMLSWNVPDLSLIVVYLFFVIVGGLLVGTPIIVLPSHLYARLSWISVFISGAVLGPASLTLVFFVIYALQGRLSSFSLAHIGIGWPLSMIASTSAVCVYVELIKRSMLANA